MAEPAFCASVADMGRQSQNTGLSCQTPGTLGGHRRGGRLSGGFVLSDDLGGPAN